MFDSLIDNLNAEKWQEVESKTPGEWQEFHINRNYQQVDETTVVIMLTDCHGENMKVDLKFCAPNKNPLNSVLLAEFLISSDETEILGIDLNSDIVVLK